MRTWVVIVKRKDGTESCFGPFTSREVTQLMMHGSYVPSQMDTVRVYELETP